MQFDFMMLGESVDQVGGGYGFSDAVPPSSAFHQIVEEQSNDVVGLEEGAVFVDDAEAICVSVGGNADVGLGLAHFLAQVVEEVVVGFGSMAAEENVATVVNGDYIDARFA